MEVSIRRVQEASSQIHSPLLGDKVDYGIGLSYRPAHIYSLTGRNYNPMQLSTLSSQSKTINWASGLWGKGNRGVGQFKERKG
jgi:hypothetical protein